jgi:hypothetical protein
MVEDSWKTNNKTINPAQCGSSSKDQTHLGFLAIRSKDNMTIEVKGLFLETSIDSFLPLPSNSEANENFTHGEVILVLGQCL